MATELHYRTCPFCEATCGLELTVEDGRLVRLTDRRDPPGLAATLLELLADAPQRARLGEAGRIYTRGLSWSAMAERHEEVYEAVLSRRDQNGNGAGPARWVDGSESARVLLGRGRNASGPGARRPHGG